MWHQRLSAYLVWCLLMATFVLLSGMLQGPAYAQPSSETTVWAAPDAEKIRPNDDIQSSNLVWSGDKRLIQVAGGGNEHVPFQVIITHPEPEGYEPEAPDGFFVETTDLSSETGATISSDQISFYLQHYIYLYGKSSPVGATGYWPDALAPIREPFSMNAEYGVVENRPIWVDVMVPDGTPAGVYSGTITVTRDGETVETLALELEVYDFSLPEESHMQAFMNTSRGRLASFHDDYSAEDIDRLTKMYHEYLYANRMESWFNDFLEPEVRFSEGQLSVHFDQSEYDYYLNQLGKKRVFIEAEPPGIPDEIEDDPFSREFNELVRSYLSQVAAFFEKHGWKDHLVINSPIDEPNSEEEYRRTRQWGQLVHKATDDVPFTATESPVSEEPEWGTLREDVDNFVAHGNYLNDPAVKKAIREEQAEGNEMTWYISCDQGYPQPNYFIDAPAMDPVMVPWITARYGMDGILYWATTWWVDTPNPWNDAVSFNSGHLCSGGYVLNGEGYLFYPGNYVEEYTGQPDVEGPVSSIRFELLREGIEDYEYLWMLRQHGAEEFAQETIRSMVVDVSAFSRNIKELYRTREAMARRIEEITQ